MWASGHAVEAEGVLTEDVAAERLVDVLGLGYASVAVNDAEGHLHGGRHFATRKVRAAFVVRQARCLDALGESLWTVPLSIHLRTLGST